LETDTVCEKIRRTIGTPGKVTIENSKRDYISLFTAEHVHNDGRSAGMGSGAMDLDPENSE
jgi:hypothetical protein